MDAVVARSRELDAVAHVVGVASSSAAQHIRSLAADQHVATAAADQPIVPGEALQRVGAPRADDLVAVPVARLAGRRRDRCERAANRRDDAYEGRDPAHAEISLLRTASIRVVGGLRAGLGLDDQRQPVDGGDPNRVAGADRPIAPGAPDLAADAHPLAVDRLGALADHRLDPGRDPVAAQEVDPEIDLDDLDQRRGRQDDVAPRLREHEQTRYRQRQEHPSNDDPIAFSAARKPPAVPRRRRVSDRRSLRVVEDDPESGTGALGDRAEAVAQSDAVIAVLALVGAIVGREDHERALGRGQHVGPALGCHSFLSYCSF